MFAIFIYTEWDLGGGGGSFEQGCVVVKEEELLVHVERNGVALFINFSGAWL